MALSNNPVVLGGGGGSGSGDVTGPASSTDNAIARYDGTGGKTLQDSAVTVSDVASSVVTVAGSSTNRVAYDAVQNVLFSVNGDYADPGTNINVAYRSATGGLILRGTGSTNDLTLRNRNNSAGWSIPGNTQAFAPETDNSSAFTLGTSARRAYQMFLGPTGVNIGGSATPGATPGTVATASKVTKTVASITDNTATAVLTVTIPNAAHSAALKVTLVGSLGAGGTVGANEATGTISYDFAITRTANANAVAGISSAYGSTTAVVATGATITVTAAASAISGLATASNTFTVNVTIARGSGTSDNHTCMIVAELANANASGITVS